MNYKIFIRNAFNACIFTINKIVSDHTTIVAFFITASGVGLWSHFSRKKLQEFNEAQLEIFQEKIDLLQERVPSS